MRFLLSVTCWLLFLTHSLAQKRSAEALSNVRLVNSSHNKIQVIQGKSILFFDLNKKADAQKFVNHLRSIPSIQRELNKLAANTEQILSLTKQILHNQTNNTLDNTSYVQLDEEKVLGPYIKKIAEQDSLIKRLLSTSATQESISILMQAKAKLFSQNNEEYQSLLSKYTAVEAQRLKDASKNLSEIYLLKAQNNQRFSYYGLAYHQLDSASIVSPDDERFIHIQQSLLRDYLEHGPLFAAILDSIHASAPKMYNSRASFFKSHDVDTAKYSVAKSHPNGSFNLLNHEKAADGTRFKIKYFAIVEAVVNKKGISGPSGYATRFIFPCSIDVVLLFPRTRERETFIFQKVKLGDGPR